MASQAGNIPRGWSYNPSAWSERWPIVGLALVGFAIASYLTAYQLRLISTVWEPFFGQGSVVILNSAVSRLLPVPDAALGAFGYLLDAVTGAIGGRSRWRTRPWLVILFGLAVGPLGAVSITLVILQPVLFGAWCSLCLASAAISLLMIGPAMDELLASLQYVRRAHRAGRSWWAAFSGAAEPVAAATQVEPAPLRAAAGQAPVWPLVAAAVLGVWLMLAPAILDYAGPAAISDWIVGPLVVSFAVVGIWDVTRPLRWLLLPLGLWLLAGPWLLDFDTTPTINSLVTGLLLLASLPFRGRLTDRFAGGWRELLSDRAELTARSA